jgi:ATP-dependent Clp protease ATP-binding subunit ClpA
MERRFTPEFRNRIDEVVVFRPLTVDEVRAIARQQIAKIEQSLLHGVFELLQQRPVQRRHLPVQLEGLRPLASPASPAAD